MTTQREKAVRFHELHRGGKILILPNAWDAASARVFELAGARAIATTSAGVAATFGYPDGQHVPRELLIGAVERIVAIVDVPVSVDAESGYGEGVDAVRETARAVLAAGAVGVNLEDELRHPEWLVERIVAVREVAGAAGVPLFVNARTDAFLRRASDPAAQVDDAVKRLKTYQAAGADGLFAPGVADPETIRRIVAAVERPLNVMAFAGVPPAHELERLGVARVSVGSGPMRATLGLARRIADELLGAGTYASFVEGAPSHGEVNAMFRRK